LLAEPVPRRKLTVFTLSPQALSPAWQVCLPSLSLLNALSQERFAKLFSCSGLAEVEVEAEAAAVAPVLFCLIT